MRIAYLIFAYRNPKLLQKTINFLACDDASFFVHIDAKVSIDDFASIRGKNVSFVDDRIRVYWAEFSGVRAILRLIRDALADSKAYDYFVLMSGSEFPIKSRQYIHAFLEKNSGQEFITMHKLPAPGKSIKRFNTVRFPSTRPVLRYVFRSLAKLGLGQRDYRKVLGSVEPYSGNTWWALTREACEYADDFVRRDTKLANFCENIHAPEETFIHTIIGNSPFAFRVRRNLVYEDWPRGAAHPRVIDAKHLCYFAARDVVLVEDHHETGEVLFARKFSDEQLELADKVIEMIQLKESVAAVSCA